MNEQERKHAAEVMASAGPWEVRFKGERGAPWTPTDQPGWDWGSMEYRVAPKPAPAIRCPACRGEMTRPLARLSEWRICSDCNTLFDPAVVKPCPECAKAKAEREGYKRAATAWLEAYRDVDRARLTLVDRCERAAKYIADRPPTIGSLSLTVGEAGHVRAILRGEDR